MIANVQSKELSDGSHVYLAAIYLPDAGVTFYLDTVDEATAQVIVDLVREGKICDLFYFS